MAFQTWLVTSPTSVSLQSLVGEQCPTEHFDITEGPGDLPASSLTSCIGIHILRRFPDGLDVCVCVKIPQVLFEVLGMTQLSKPV